MRANTVMPFAFTLVSSLLIVSFDPWLLRIVVNPSAAIACTPDRHITAVNAKIFSRRKACPVMPSVNIDAVRRFVDNDREGHGLLLEGNLGQGIVSFGKGRSSPPIIRQACDHAADEKQSVVRGNSADKVASALGRTPKSALKTLRRSSPQIANAKSSAGLVTAGPAMKLR